MRRRSLLASAGASLASLSGCLLLDAERDEQTESRRQADDQPPPTTQAGTDSPTPPFDARVDSMTQHQGLVFAETDSIRHDRADQQFVSVQISDGDGVPRDDFLLRVGSGSHEPTTIDRLYRTDWGEDAWYDAERGSGLLMFEVPPEGDGAVTLQWPGGEWEASDALADRITSEAPPMSASLDLPTEHEGSAPPRVRIDVTNDGESDGRFLAALNRVGPAIAYTPVRRVSVLVEAGESRTVGFEDSWGGDVEDDRRGDGEADVTYRMDSVAGEDQAEIRLI